VQLSELDDESLDSCESNERTLDSCDASEWEEIQSARNSEAGFRCDDSAAELLLL